MKTVIKEIRLKSYDKESISVFDADGKLVRINRFVNKKWELVGVNDKIYPESYKNIRFMPEKIYGVT